MSGSAMTERGAGRARKPASLAQRDSGHMQRKGRRAMKKREYEPRWVYQD